MALQYLMQQIYLTKRQRFRAFLTTNLRKVLVYMLAVNTTYTLETRYYHWISSGDHSDDPACFVQSSPCAME